MMFEQTFKNIDDILHKDAGCGSELDYVEQTSWILFLKYLDDLEKDRVTAAELTGKPYTPIIDKEYQWTVWAMTKKKKGDSELVELSNTDNATVAIRKHLLESCNLHTVLDLPGGTFTGAGVKTVVLFFEKGRPTQKVWFYQLNLDRNLGKTNPLNENDLAEFVQLQKSFADSENSWAIHTKEIDQNTFDLSVKNPHRKEEVTLRSPQSILEEIKALDEESAEILKMIEELL
jgi:type I restriction-modification system DNA methylase subunit